MKVSFIHTGDLHLGRQFHFKNRGDTFGYNKRNDLWKTFERIVNTVEQNNIHLLLIAGDLFDSDCVDYAEVDRVSNRLGELSTAKVVIIGGNHDYLSPGSAYDLVTWPENVTILEPGKMDSVYFSDLDTEVFGLSWAKDTYTEMPVTNLPPMDPARNNILMLHGDVYHTQSNYMPLSLRLSDAFDYVALGHYHKYDAIRDKIAYCGSPESLDFGETGVHGMIVGEIKDHRCRTRFIPTQTRQVITAEVRITPDLSMDEIVRKIKDIATPESRERDYFKVKLSGFYDIDLDPDWIVNEVTGLFYYIECDFSDLKVDIDIEALLKANKNNVIGQFITEMSGYKNNPIAQKALYLGLKGILQTTADTK